MKRDKTLLDLPVVPKYREGCSATVEETYVQELKAVTTEEQLRSFLARWRNVWLLHCPQKATELFAEEMKILNNDFDAQEVLALLARREELGEHEPGSAISLVAHILVPSPLLEAHILARHYGVGADVGLCRMYLDPYPKYDNKLR